ncbi:hypothetical protein LL965_09100 [Xanthomonas cassavae CFBP 4642]|uniref:Uncharacterized protein n=1 Tax=Xanthomonas cassavae CFBP 4642 TaxID=1219375 RepID=A0ABS8HGH2_9XANT|nr:hypothetical protein [Xanthomonas cassavae]MCC4620235.1 hypothetical protein [Xanthomonas cassavae CFBP 4642]
MLLSGLRVGLEAEGGGFCVGIADNACARAPPRRRLVSPNGCVGLPLLCSLLCEDLADCSAGVTETVPLPTVAAYPLLELL